jgi:hypothetical protein
MTQIAEMPWRICKSCANTFQPKPGGWNAKYCSDTCRQHYCRSVNKRPSRAGQETYYRRVVKTSPEKLAAHMARSTVNQKKIRQWLADYKLAQGCVDCGFNSHPAALQIDHNGHKVAEISLLRSSIKRMQSEIDSGKCVVRCANCHSIKTWAEKNKIPNPSGHCVYNNLGGKELSITEQEAPQRLGTVIFQTGLEAQP